MVKISNLPPRDEKNTSGPQDPALEQALRQLEQTGRADAKDGDVRVINPQS
ncbi:hypothetical protein AB0L00_32450 [Actinoallomurus sp. NPDC052308]|uniref:hypothetical protein n=1 Tax=Actinoallomurus sp. NPDC052308 TaxID=3155530 RepID=UPI003448600B